MHIINEVRGVYPLVQNQGALDVQLRHDVGDDGRCRSGGQSQHRRALQRSNRVADGPIGRAKIMAPLRDAMGFVHYDPRHTASLGLLALRSDVNNFGCPTPDVLQSVLFIAPRVKVLVRTPDPACE